MGVFFGRYDLYDVEVVFDVFLDYFGGCRLSVVYGWVWKVF